MCRIIHDVAICQIKYTQSVATRCMPGMTRESAASGRMADFGATADRVGQMPLKMDAGRIGFAPAVNDAELIARHDGRAPRYTSYPTAPHFTAAVGPEVYARWLRALPADAPLSIYLHVPFCDRLCLYCGCNMQVVRLESAHRAYADKLIREIDHVAGLIGRRAPVAHVHWGGGTPTSLPGDCLIAIMERLRERFAFKHDAEIAIEIDPTSLPPDRRAALAPMGVTRMSLGVQDLEPAVQQAIGREQTYEETEACADAARALGVDSLNLDLIYGLPLQTAEGVARTARRALDLKPDRVAVFGYAHVPWMKRHQALLPEDKLPGPVERYAQLKAVHRVLTEEGYVPIGLDHYALPSDAMAVASASHRLKRGFQGYTTDSAPALIGLGASSIGSLPQGYVQNAPAAAAYSKMIEAGRLATVRGVELSEDDRVRRAIIERLMCELTVDLDLTADEHGADPEPLKAACSRQRALRRAQRRLAMIMQPRAAAGGDDQALWYQCIGIVAAVRHHLHPAGKRGAPRISQLLDGVRIQSDTPVDQQTGREVGQAQACIARRQAVHVWSRHQPPYQRRRVQLDTHHIIELQPLALAQFAQHVQTGMGRAADGKYLVADLLHLRVASGQSRQRWCGVIHPFDQRQITEWPLQHIARCREPFRGKRPRRERRARVESDLKGQSRRALDMRLHGAGKMAVDQAERALQRFRIGPIQLCNTRGGAQRATHGRPEEAHRRACADAQQGCHVDRHHHGADQTLAVDTTTLFSCRDQSGQDHRHRMHDGGHMHTIEFLVVDLEAIDQRSTGRRQRLAGHPNAGVAAAAQGCAHPAHIGRPLDLRTGSGKTYRHGIHDEGLRHGNRGWRQIGVASGSGMRDQRFGQAHRRIY